MESPHVAAHNTAYPVMNLQAQRRSPFYGPVSNDYQKTMVWFLNSTESPSAVGLIWCLSTLQGTTKDVAIGTAEFEHSWRINLSINEVKCGNPWLSESMAIALLSSWQATSEGLGAFSCGVTDLNNAIR
jgi:hypothetical protein